MILPPTGTAASYIFPQRDLPAAPFLSRFFPNQTGRTLAVTADGEPVTLYQLPANRPDYRPERAIVARFGNQLMVSGFDFPRDVTAGQTLIVRWYWTMLAPDTRQLTFFNHVIGDDNAKQGAIDGRAFVPGYWPAGTSGVSTFEVPIDPATITGAYELVTGVYYRDDLERLPIFDTLGREAGSQLELGPIKVHGRPAPSPVVADAQPTRFGDQIGLLGSDVVSTETPSGDKVRVTLYWSARGRPAAMYTIFVHLLDANQRVVGSGDAPPDSGQYPTSLWDNGDIITDSHDVSVDASIRPGRYTLEVGLYLPQSGLRLPVVDVGGHVLGDRVLLPSVSIDSE